MTSMVRSLVEYNLKSRGYRPLCLRLMLFHWTDAGLSSCNMAAQRGGLQGADSALPAEFGRRVDPIL